MVESNRIIERTAWTVAMKDTLVIHTTDHSFDLRVRAGRKGESLLAHPEAPKPSLRRDKMMAAYPVRRSATWIGEPGAGPPSGRGRVVTVFSCLSWPRRLLMT